MISIWDEWSSDQILNFHVESCFVKIDYAGKFALNFSSSHLNLREVDVNAYKKK